MHHRSGSWVKGHYRNGTWIAGHNRKSTYVSDYTKNYYARSVLSKPVKINTFKHLPSEKSKMDESIKKFNIERDKNIYIVTVLEREKNRIKPPTYEQYFKGTFEEELAYNRSYRLRSITSRSVSIAEKYLGRVIGQNRAKLLKDQAIEEYYLDNNKTETLQRTEHAPRSEKETIVNTIFKKAKALVLGQKAVRVDGLANIEDGESRARVEANRAKTKAEKQNKLDLIFRIYGIDNNTIGYTVDCDLDDRADIEKLYETSLSPVNIKKLLFRIDERFNHNMPTNILEFQKQALLRKHWHSVVHLSKEICT